MSTTIPSWTLTFILDLSALPTSHQCGNFQCYYANSSPYNSSVNVSGLVSIFETTEQSTVRLICQHPTFYMITSHSWNSLRAPHFLQDINKVEKLSHIPTSYAGMKGLLSCSFLSLQLHATLILLWILTQIFKIWKEKLA